MHEGYADAAAAVYDVTIAFTRRGDPPGARPPAPSLADMVTRRYGAVHVHVARIPLAAVPTDPALRAQWLVGRFKEKDRLLTRFYAGGGFPGAAWTDPLPWRAALARTVLWASLYSLALGTRAGRRLYLMQWVAAGLGGILVMATGR